VHFTEAQIKQASKMRWDWAKSLMKPRKQAVEVLSSLKSQKHKIGLLSDCSIEIPPLWKELPLECLVDAAVFSCSAGMKKPDPRIYRMVTDQLKVEPGDCLYVGDGSSHELTGASQAGLHPVLIQIHDLSDAFQAEAEGHAWKGPVISSLKQVLDLVK
jgi:putative hydrolase of the HAD superfamily